jgi:uncharacterized membrane protein YbhN (UPF0104 family)
MLAGGMALAAVVVLLVLAFRPHWGQQAVRWLLGLLPRLDGERWAKALDGLFEGLAPLRSGRRGLAVLVWSVVTWGCVIGLYWAVLRAFLSGPSILMASFVVCATGLGMAVPSSPGALGVFQAAVVYALTIPFNIPDDQAITVAFAAHAFNYVSMCLLGLIGLGRESLSLSWVREQAATVEEGE